MKVRSWVAESMRMVPKEVLIPTCVGGGVMMEKAGKEVTGASMGVSMGGMVADTSTLDDILNAPGPATAISMLRPVRETRTPCCVGV